MKKTMMIIVSVPMLILFTWIPTSEVPGEHRGWDVDHASPTPPCNSSFPGHGLSTIGGFPPVDFIYCWKGENTLAKVGNEQEMRYSIRSLEKFAPWFNHAYLLVNGPQQPPSWLTICAKDRIKMIDRCTLFENHDDCPTFNTHACQAVAHKVPNLEEHFVLFEDDMFLTRSTAPTDFFTVDGKPIIYMESGWPIVQVYGESHEWLPGPNLPPSMVPQRLRKLWHNPVPLLRSFSLSLETIFSEWFAFVRSHKYRFTCCNASLRLNGLEEDLGRVNQAMLLNSGMGVQRKAYDGFCEFGGDHWPKGLLCLQKKLKDSKFVNVNNLHGPAVIRVFRTFLMDVLGGAPPSQLIVSGSL